MSESPSIPLFQRGKTTPTPTIPPFEKGGLGGILSGGVMAEQLPNGWLATSLSEISSKLVDGSHNPPAKQATGLPMLSAVNINDNKILFSDFRLITEAGFKQEDQRTKITPGDVLLTIVGAIGRTAVVPEGIQQFTLQRSVAVITPVLVSSKFLMYQIESPRVARYFTDNARGTAQKGVYLKTLGATEIWLPPLAEQHRIVAKIEELFSELDQGVASLKTAREQIKVYRQSLLKNAFEGKLTATWRAAHRDQLETATALQQRIAHERQARYQQQLADWQAAGQPGPKPKQPKPLPPPTVEELAELPELPGGWWWFSLGAACFDSVLGKMLDKEKNKGELKPYLRNVNVRWGSFVLDGLLEMRFEESEFQRYSLVEGDLVICEGGEPGRCAVWKEAFSSQMYVQKALHRVRFTPSVDPCFVQLYFEYAASNRRLESLFTGTTIKHLTGEKLVRFALPLCNRLEQIEVMAELESKLSEADQLDQTLATALQQADALRQSILKKAFCGQLVKQAKNEEPATALLERIRAEHLSGPGKKKTRLTAGATR